MCLPAKYKCKIYKKNQPNIKYAENTTRCKLNKQTAKYKCKIYKKNAARYRICRKNTTRCKINEQIQPNTKYTDKIYRQNTAKCKIYRPKIKVIFYFVIKCLFFGVLPWSKAVTTILLLGLFCKLRKKPTKFPKSFFYFPFSVRL